MSLFTSGEVKVSPERDAGQPLALTRPTRHRPSTHSGALAQLQETVAEIATDSLLHYVTYGKWSLHHLIRYLVQQTGPANLYLTTWSMTEDPVRALLMLRQEGLIKRADCLLSERISERTPQVMQLAHNVFDRLKFYKSHAKAFILERERMSLVNIGSANLTRNKKNEIGVVDSSPEAVAFHLKWMKNEFKKAEQKATE